jgi:hypothetical protein
MSLTVQPVNVTRFHQTWPLVEKFLSDALKWGDDDYTMEQAKVNLANGVWMLAVAVDAENKIHGASIINIYNMPNDRIAFVVAIGGRLISSQEAYAQFCQLLKAHGATKIQGAARESVAKLWAKKYNFKERYRIVEAKI